jgi:hypothetical protein
MASPIAKAGTIEGSGVQSKGVLGKGRDGDVWIEMYGKNITQGG